MKPCMYFCHVYTCTHTHTHPTVATGRMNRMFQVLPDQEENIYIGDMLSDDIIVVELDSSPVSTPECKPKILLSPVDGGEETFR